MNEELTEQEEIHYANYGYIGNCDCCNDDSVPITNYHDGNNYLTFTGVQFLCQKCLK